MPRYDVKELKEKHGPIVRSLVNRMGPIVTGQFIFAKGFAEAVRGGRERLIREEKEADARDRARGTITLADRERTGVTEAERDVMLKALAGFTVPRALREGEHHLVFRTGPVRRSKTDIIDWAGKPFKRVPASHKLGKSMVLSINEGKITMSMPREGYYRPIFEWTHDRDGNITGGDHISVREEPRGIHGADGIF